MTAVHWIIVVHVTGIVLDVALALNSTPNHIDTISAKLKHVSAVAPIWVYALSMLIGHFALQPWWTTINQPLGVLLLAGLGVAWFAAGTWLRGGTLTAQEIFWTNLIAIQTGVLAGMLLWPQRPLDSIPNLF